MGVAQCTECSRFVCTTCKVVQVDGRALCRSCAHGRTGLEVAFERRTEPFFTRYLRTAREAFFQPRQFMERLDPHGAVGPALLFAFLATIVGRMVGFLWGVLLFPDIFSEQIAVAAEETGLTAGNIQLMIMTVVVPLRVVMSLTLGIMLLYVGALFAGADPPFRLKGYARIYGYAAVANLLWIVPVMGVFLAVWCVTVICWYAMAIHHSLPRGRAFIAVVPMALGTLLFEFQNGM